MLAIEAKEINKKFKETIALDGINLEVKKGEIYGLVGPDGAGKTTLMRILTGIMSADSGIAKIMGIDALKNPEDIKSLIGYMSQRFSLYGDLTVEENMLFYSDLFELTKKQRKQKFKQLLGFSRLEPFLNRRADALSGGMKQKLGLSCALIHTPQLLFLDEPTTGVDPVSRRELWMILYDLWKEGMTIFVSTPYLDEAERCSRVGFINKGKIIAVDKPEEMIKNATFSIIRVLFDDVSKVRTTLQTNINLPPFNLFGNYADFLSSEYSKDKSKIMEFMKKNKIQYSKVERISPTLEDVFLYLTRERMEN